MSKMIRPTDMTEVPKHYDEPTLVCFLEPGVEDTIKECLVVGIAYCDKIICGCCGGIFELEDLAEYAAPAIGYHELKWIPFDQISEYMEDIVELVKAQQERWHAYCLEEEATHGEHWYEG